MILNIIERMNGHVTRKIAETDKYTFYDNKVFSKSQWRILKWQSSYKNVTQMKTYVFKNPYIQLTPKYKMEHPVTLEQIQEFTKKHNLKFWI
tara:strand:- start:458 stop:733 length:276 start_codon:yes stop_codon:yes gene_type:complete